MYGDKRFNIRVYGIWIRNGHLLVNDELIRGEQIIKLPGGGLEYGEGLADCLIREWKEELDIDISIEGHFYTTDFFQHSAFDNTQVISVYYLVSGEERFADTVKNINENERAYWLPMAEVSEDSFTMPIDKKIGGMLQELYINGKL